ncbi:MAG: CRISPR-associated endonuclease Cas1, partial [Anaerolineae bacterium]|nr:CRISPR-associated endonuclease Cas1 [Anaerolineae bacterium]
MSTLYLSQPGAQLHKEHDRLLVKRGDEVLEAVPLIKVDQVVLMGRGVSITTSALHALTRKGADIVYLSGAGRYVSRVIGPEHKNGRLRHQQSLLASDPHFALQTAQNIVHGKIVNQRALVQRHAERASWAERALSAMDDMARRATSSQDLDQLRGMEGQAAREYFGLMRRLLRPPAEGGSWHFEQRAYYPPTDPVNALLSFTYSLVLRDMTTACELIGLDPYLGFFHAIDYGRPSMALDLMEEFRPIVADSIVLEAVNRPYVSLADFEEVDLTEIESERDENEAPRATVHAVYLSGSGREKIIAMYENRVNDESMFAYQDQHVSYRY